MELDLITFKDLREGDRIICDGGIEYRIMHNKGHVVKMYDHNAGKVISCMWSENFKEVLTCPGHVRVIVPKAQNAQVVKIQSS
ncbi:MAG: hypothetical protein A3E93_01240 [Candidatus Zambryskibacteria bacterium RIFCSPHIGHO2_12_FULL_43_12b]|uniref:Uncharacterized protein n=1 Tax=Candidatus Zambryskibacteria bacterium RIFCSPLOWO2_01_FULL_43_17 TaxID=1802760 RepID=A0A1G2U450_9BACT|nr:MAG: hypothetical protein A3E93_01240 [Candidatus Zambryskibacteria bacterium RIFCSPHIGHO2_12_FULL_43_12b]OHB04275.1 MAG: hypothetical protein A2920_01020 [Candidatus Zambryskibacteria bacterium RIFCSPLOWO2_01_FULL_43_17]